MSEYEYEHEQAKENTQAPDTHNAYEELVRQVDRLSMLPERAEKRLAAVLSQPFTADGNAPKRDRFPSALGEQVSRFSDALDALDEILRRVDL